MCHKTCLSLQYLICIRIFQKNVLLYFHSFIPLACAECDDSLPFSGVFHSLLLYTFSCHPSPTIPPSSLTSSCNFFLGLPLNLLLFPNSCIILFHIFYFLLLLYSYTVRLVKYFSNRGCAFEIHVVMKHKSSDMTLYVRVYAAVGPNRILLCVCSLYMLCVYVNYCMVCHIF